MTPDGPGVEVEATLAVVGSGAEAVADRIAGLEELAGCTVASGPPREIRDAYLDRGAEELRGAGLALRLRFVGADVPVLGVKDAGRRLAAGGVARREREAPWSEAAARLLSDELERAGLAAPDPALDPSRSPLEALRAAGFRVVQDRETLRRPAALVRDGETVAELVVDEVRYRVAGGTVVHREVEVEAAASAEDPGALVGRAAEALADRFGAALRPWDHPKLATGRALERLAEQGGREALVDRGGRPRPSTYDRLERALEADGEDGRVGG